MKNVFVLLGIFLISSAVVVDELPTRERITLMFYLKAHSQYLDYYLAGAALGAALMGFITPRRSYIDRRY